MKHLGKGKHTATHNIWKLRVTEKKQEKCPNIQINNDTVPFHDKYVPTTIVICEIPVLGGLSEQLCETFQTSFVLLPVTTRSSHCSVQPAQQRCQRNFANFTLPINTFTPLNLLRHYTGHSPEFWTKPVHLRIEKERSVDTSDNFR